MGFNDEYLKLRKKRLEGEGQDDTSGGGMLYQNKTLPKEDVAPIVTSTKKKQEDEGEGKKWWQGFVQKGDAFKDGYQIGDVTKTLLGTDVDIATNLLSGIVGWGENAADAAATGLGMVSEKMGWDGAAKKLNEFAQKDLYDENKVARKILTSNMLPTIIPGTESLSLAAKGLFTIEDWLNSKGDDNSVLGDASDSLIQSAGETVVKMGAPGIGNIITGVTVFGEQAEQALREDATFGQASGSGLISAAAEIMFEKLSGGIKIGGSTLDEGLTKIVAKNISNVALRNAVHFGLDVVGEAGEEVATEFVSKLGTKLYKEEDLGEILFSEDALNDYIQAAIGGGLMGGAFNVSGAVSGTKHGVDYKTGLSNDESRVIDTIIDERIKEREKDGKLTGKEKETIREQVMRDLERGGISVDDIERILGGETYQTYQNALNEQKSLQDEYDALYKMKNGEKSDEQIDRQKELKAKLEEIAQKDQVTTLKTQLSESVLYRAKGTRLAESYNERARRGQAFEADLSQYDEKQAEIVKKAAESGILNNTNRTHEFVDMVAKISADKGVLFDFTNNAKLKESGFAVEGATVNGYFDKKTNTVGVNIDSAKALDTVVGHEITHVLEGTELYSELQKAVFDYAKTKGEFDGRRAALAKLYAEEDIDSEMTADLIGEYLFTDADFVQNLSVTNRNVFQKIYDEIKYLYKLATAGSKEARKLEEVKRAFDKAYREGVKAQTNAKDGVKNSLSDSDGNTLTKEQSEYFKSSKIRDGNGNLKVMHHGTNESFTVFDKRKARSGGTYGKGFYFTDSTSHAATYGESIDVYLNITNPIQNGTTNITKDQIRKFVEAIAADEDYGIDNYGYDATIDSVTDSVYGKSDFGMILDLNISCIGDMVEAVELFNKVNGTNYDGIIAPTETVAFYPEQIKRIDNEAPTGDPDIRYSLSDSDGKQLSKGQQEYFKDSKMRDENGNLMVMYHGSQDAGFHVFDPGMSDDDTSFFFVDRNDVAASYSGTSETYEAQSIRTAEDMNKFIESIGVEGYEVIEHDGKFDLIYEDDLIASRDTVKEIYDEFCWYESVGEGDANYKVYLNLKNPLVLDAKGRPWNKIDAEFSQEIYDKYQSLTAEEKDALIDLAEWEDFSLFNSEIQEATEGDLASAYAKMGEDCNIYDLFSVAADNFSEESMRENARGYLKTRDYAQRAKEQGYDGVIFNNIVDNGGYSNGSEGASTVAIAFESSQIKSVANENPTGDADIRYSLTEYTAEEKKAHNDAVLSHFGRTFKWAETGYLLLDGERLDLSGKHDGAPGGYRTVDHRDITDALGYDYGGGEYSGSLIQFMSEGNIRIVPEIGGINLSVKPTKAQEQALSDYISRNRGEVVLDIDDLKGNTVVSVEYPRGTFYKKVLDDIREWFDNGKQPEVSGLSSFRSLSTKGEAPGKGRFYGKDMRLEVAPVAETVGETVGETKTEVAPEAVAPVADWMPEPEETYAPSLYDLRDERDSLREMMLAVQDDLDAVAPLAQRYGEVMQQIQQLEADENARLTSLDDADVPPEMEAPYVAQREPITIDGKSLDKITGEVGDMLGLDAESRERMSQTIQNYAQSGDKTESDLFDEILDNYEYYEEMQIENDEAGAARRFIKGTKLYLHESLKGDFNGKRKDGFNAFRREHFGHFTITTQKGAGAMSVDSLYSELADNFPDLFPADIGNSADMLQRMADVASMKPKVEYRTGQFDPDTVGEAVELIRSGVAQYAQDEKFKAFNKEGDRLLRMYGKELAPVVDTPTIETANTSEVMGQQTMFEEPAKKDRFEQMLEREMAALEQEFAQRKAEMEARLQNKDAYISGRAMELYNEISNLKKGVRASKELGYLLDHGFTWNTIKSKLLTIKRYPGEVINPDSVEESVIREALSREYEDKVYELSELGNEYQKQVTELEQSIERARKEAEKAEQLIKRAELHKVIVDRVRSEFAAKGFDFDKVLKNAKNLSTFRTVDNTPQRVMEKALGYKQGQILADETVNKVAQNETEGIRWLNSFTDRKSGLLAKISKQYGIKPGSKESAAAQMYAEGFFVSEQGDAIFYGDAELARDFPDARTQENIKGLAADPRIRKIYDETLAAINESRVRNGYPEIPKLDNYFLHFRAMDDTFSTLGLPFNPNDIRAKDLPTDLNGVTADLKPGQPYFASAMHRRGVRTTHDLLGGLERYLGSAKNQIYHIDDIQTLRALRNYIADTYGQANGLDSLDVLTEEEVEERIKQVYGAHLSTFAKFLNEEANVLAGKTALIDRGLEGIIGRRGMTFIDNLNKQVGSNMVGYNVSSSLTNFLPVVQTFAKTNKYDFVKGFAQTVSNRVGSIAGGGDNFAQNSPVMIRRKGADRFHRTAWQKLGDPGYALMGAVDSISTEIIARAKYNELTRKGLTSAQAHTVTDKWVSRLMGDRSLGQMPQLYNSKMLGLVTKFQLEVRNQLDSQFYDTIQEAKVSNEQIENQLERNAKTAAKVASTFFQLAVAQHIFGAVFESIAGYNPAFDIIEVIMTALGWDDEEDSEDTVLDNVEQGFLALLEDLPYTSTLTGGRIPISNALPIEQLIKGKDEYGNDKPRWKTALEALPYYVSPGGYGQAKKTAQGLSMFSDKLPVTGSYTDSGNLRFPVEKTPGNVAQAAVFGQWASDNARYYFDNDIAPLNEKQTQEYADVGMSIRDYWSYRKGLSGLKTLEEKAEYINGLDLTDEQKNILINNIVDRKEDIDMSDYDQYGSFEEFNFAAKNPEKYEFFKANGISYEQYNASEESREAYSWAYNNPEKYTLSKAVSSDVVTYRKYASELYDIKADKDEDGKSIIGSRKEKVIDYVNNLDIDYGERLILFKSEYNADDTYNEDIIDYLNNREDISYDEMVTILTELGFTVKNGNVYWD